MARSERFELPTLGIEIRCSIQLSYERVPGARGSIIVFWAEVEAGRTKKAAAEAHGPQGASPDDLHF